MSFTERHNIIDLSDIVTSLQPLESFESDNYEKRTFDRQATVSTERNQSIFSSLSPNLSKSIPMSKSNSCRLLSTLRPHQKNTFLPEEKIYFDEMVEKCQHFDKSYDKHHSIGIRNYYKNVESERNKIGKTKNHSTNLQLLKHKEEISSSLSEYDQKHSQLSKTMEDEAIKINESSETLINRRLTLPLQLNRITALSLIKKNNSILCGRNDSNYEGIKTYFNRKQDDDASLTSKTDTRQKHYHRLDASKPIKTLTSSEENTCHQQPNILILMNDDCKSLQVQDELPSKLVSSIGIESFVDKYCKNFHPRDDKNDYEINENTKTNLRIEGKHNLDFDLQCFSKKLSACPSRQEIRSFQQQQASDNDNKIAITHIEVESGDDKTHATRNYDDELKLIGINNSCNSSDSYEHLSDCFSSFSSLTCNSTSSTTFSRISDSNASLTDARSHDCFHRNADNGINRGKIFTNGEFFYGPYDFDLFSNEFYQFRDSNSDSDEKTSKAANDDEAEKLGNATHVITTSELLKNHDEVDNKTELSFVRDVDIEKGCEILRNNNNNNNNSPSKNDRVGIELNITNCLDDDERDALVPTIRNDDVAVVKNFNYVSSKTFDHSLIDLMDEGDNDVGTKRECASGFDDSQIVCRNITSTDYAKNYDMSHTLSTPKPLNYSQEFNYKRNKIVEITHENEHLLEPPPRNDCYKMNTDEKFYNDQRFIIVDNNGDNDEIENIIRFKERWRMNRQPNSLMVLSSSDPHCDELDSYFLTNVIDFDNQW
ncbi:CLUMA_CG013388, isoform A [Clunio marinus]|uniref:CLUMA_CG013388, isoform A n=1 Tax=Clunio marinus TaxID=568069 RepID=A0A1J1IIR1_9DIPT|nr:CLUMA_CG013388, isoform A [Clunio marinus]